MPPKLGCEPKVWELSQSAADFVGFYHEYHDISASRRREQKRALHGLEQFAGVPLVDVDADTMQTYLATLVSDGLSPNTVRKVRSLLRPAFYWLWERGLIDSDRRLRIEAIKLPRGAVAQGVPRPYKREQILRLWADIAEQYPLVRDEPHHLLYRWRHGQSPYRRRIERHGMRLQLEAIVAIALYAGPRVSEIYAIGYEDMHYDNGVIVINGARKNREGRSLRRTAPMNEPLAARIRAWFEFRELLEPTHDFPWLSLSGQYRANRLVWNRFNALLTRLGRGWEFHRLRHTAATEMLRSGMQIQNVKRIMGHSRIEQTLAYTLILDEDVIEDAERAQARRQRRLEP